MKKGRKRKTGWVDIYDIAREPVSKRWSLIHDTNSADLKLWARTLTQLWLDNVGRDDQERRQCCLPFSSFWTRPSSARTASNTASSFFFKSFLESCHSGSLNTTGSEVSDLSGALSTSCAASVSTSASSTSSSASSSPSPSSSPSVSCQPTETESSVITEQPDSNPDH